MAKEKPVEKSRYAQEELQEFDNIILEKLSIARKELSFIQDSLQRKTDNNTADLPPSVDRMEEGIETTEREQFYQLATRQRRFIKQLEDARIRIKNGTYGICVDTGKLISKERLRAVPHTTHSIEAKLKKNKP